MLNFWKTSIIATALVATGLIATSHAETSTKVRKSTTTITTVESEGEDWPTDASPSPSPIQESEITATFGSKATTGMAGCKTEELSKNVIKELKADCKAWLKDQKADLKNRYSTGVCEESCSDCSMGLQRCNVKGTVRYRP